MKLESVGAELGADSCSDNSESMPCLKSKKLSFTSESKRLKVAVLLLFVMELKIVLSFDESVVVTQPVAVRLFGNPLASVVLFPELS